MRRVLLALQAAIVLLAAGYVLVSTPRFRPATSETTTGSRPPDRTEGDVLLLFHGSAADPESAAALAVVALAAGLAGVAGGLFAFAKGSISPETIHVGRSIDGLVMVLLGGIQTLTGPIVGAIVIIALLGLLAPFLR